MTVFRQDRWDNWFFAATTAVVAATVIALYLVSQSGPGSTNMVAATSAGPRSRSATEDPATAAAQDNARPAERVIATVYECRANSRSIYSDRRCGQDAQRRSIRRPNGMDPQDTRILSVPVPAPSVAADRRGTGAVAPDEARLECSSIESEKDSINARMRSGYGSAEGEWLRGRLRALDARYHDLHCHHFH